MATLYFDLGSPYAYLSVQRAAAVLGAAPHLQPVLAGAIFNHRGHGSWGHADTRAANQAEIEARAARYGLPPIQWPPGWPPNTLQAMRAMVWAAAGPQRRRHLRARRVSRRLRRGRRPRRPRNAHRHRRPRRASRKRAHGRHRRSRGQGCAARRHRRRDRPRRPRRPHARARRRPPPLRRRPSGRGRLAILPRRADRRAHGIRDLTGLHRPQRGVEPARRDQLIVRPALGDPPALQDVDARRRGGSSTGGGR